MEPKFKVGDIIQSNSYIRHKILAIDSGYYWVGFAYPVDEDKPRTLTINHVDQFYTLAPKGDYRKVYEILGISGSWEKRVGDFPYNSASEAFSNLRNANEEYRPFGVMNMHNFVVTELTNTVV